jgi:4-amino-4-deoxy-L-arabinose transferase-like glycosyltransferase
MRNEVLRTPMYPAFIAGIYAVFGVKPYMVLLAQIFVNVSTAYLFYRIVEMLARPAIAAIALFLFAVEPIQILYTTVLYSDTLYLFFTMLSLFWLIKGMKNTKTGMFILSGIALGLAVLTRPAGQYLVVLYILFIFFYGLGKNRKRKFSAIPPLGGGGAAIVLLVFYLLSIFPWAMRNYVLHDRFKLSNTMELNLFIISTLRTAYENSSLPRDSINNYFMAQLKEAAPEHLKNEIVSNITQSFEKADVYAKVAKQYLMSHKKAFVWSQIKGCMLQHIDISSKWYMLRLHQEIQKPDVTGKFSSGLWATAQNFFATKMTVKIFSGLFMLTFLLVVYAFVAVGIYFSFKNKDFYILLLCILNSIYYLIMVGIFPFARFRHPYMPFYIFLAAYGMYYFFKQIKKQRVERQKY